MGIDISAQMIRLAREQENEHPLGIEYLVKDALELSKIGGFDRVFSSYLLAYAQPLHGCTGGTNGAIAILTRFFDLKK